MTRSSTTSIGLVVALLSSVCAERAAATSQPVHPAGRDLYFQNCASCHGVGGHGDGPVASSLREPPPDLTTLAQRAGGHFDERRVLAVIDGEHLVAAHGPREMPVWGVIFDKELKDAPYGSRVRLLRGHVLADYLKTIQQH